MLRYQRHAGEIVWSRVPSCLHQPVMVMVMVMVVMVVVVAVATVMVVTHMMVLAHLT